MRSSWRLCQQIEGTPRPAIVPALCLCEWSPKPRFQHRRARGALAGGCAKERSGSARGGKGACALGRCRTSGKDIYHGSNLAGPIGSRSHPNQRLHKAKLP
eukprot:14010390-Alexandrium_andersonii.AAC.1